jgi:hypothetical protein
MEIMAEITTGILIFLLGFICSMSIATYQVDTALKIMDRMIDSAEKANKALEEVIK